MKPEQLELLTTVSAPSLSPDSTRVVVSASRPSFASDSYVGQVWELPLDASAQPRRITRGEADRDPRYSPDGQRIAFLRTDATGKAQLAVIDANGGEPHVLTDRPLGVGAFTWSPDSRSIAFCSRTPENGRYGSIEGVGANDEDPRRIDTFNYRGDGLGFGLDKVQGLFSLDVPASGAEPFIRPRGRAARGLGPLPAGLPVLTDLAVAASDLAEPSYGPDGVWIYFTSSLHRGHDTDLRSMIYKVPSKASAPSVPELVLGDPEGQWSFRSACWSHDGSTLFALAQNVGESGIDFLARQTAVAAVPAASLPAAQAKNLTDQERLDYTESDTLVRHGADGVLAVARVRGTGELHRIDANGAVRVLSSGPRFVHGAAASGTTIVVSHASEDSTGECAVLSPVLGGKSSDIGELRQLSDFAAMLFEQTRISLPQEVTFSAPDGYPVHGWIHRPEGPGPHPVLLNIHGGPFSQYGPAYFDEAQVYAAAGYAVLQCNPRGSASYGREHGLAIRHAMGTVDMDDVMAFLDGACGVNPELDGERVGILGGSYGGYLTAWTIAHEHRFAAAMVERGFLDPVSFAGTSDIGWFFADAYTGSDPQRVAEQSPMAKIGQVRTPTLVMHSEGDYRCPLEQAQRYYVGLKQLGVPTEFVLFPGESHGLSRGGSPWHRRQRFEIIIDWFNRYLPVAAPESGEPTAGEPTAGKPTAGLPAT